MHKFLVPISTCRLNIRALIASDLEAVFKILSCKQTSGGRAFEKRTLEEAECWLANRMADEETLGFSMWAVEDKTREIVGLCGFLDHQAELELGYVIYVQHQGKGYGTEAADGAVQAAQARGFDVLATIRPSNYSSIRVAEKIGMKRTSEVLVNAPDLVVYRSISA